MAKSKYESILLHDNYQPAGMKAGLQRHYVTPLVGKLKGIGPGVLDSTCNGLDVAQVMKLLLHNPEQLVDRAQYKSDALRQTTLDKINKIADNARTKLRNPEKTLRLLMQLSGFQQKQITKVMSYIKDNKKAIENYLKNPYRLLKWFPSLPAFTRCDTIALLLCLPSNSDYRYEGLILAQVVSAKENGNICLRAQQIKDQMLNSNGIYDLSAYASAKSNFISEQDFDRHIQNLIAQKMLCVSTYNGEQFLYLNHDAEMEKDVAMRIQKRVQMPGDLFSHVYCDTDNRTYSYDPNNLYPIRDDSVDLFLDLYEQYSHMKLANKQRLAVKTFFKNRLMILCGAAGYGKTATLAAICSGIRFFYGQEFSAHKTHKDAQNVETTPEQELMRLAGSTGRAAQQMMIALSKGNAQSVQASTIHSLYHISPSTMGKSEGYMHNIDAKFVMIDESSMIDLPLMYYILRHTGKDTHLLFIGDPNQLPSVGPGRVFHDMIDSHNVPTVTLDHLFRTGAGSQIAINSTRILQGQMISAHRADFDKVTAQDINPSCVWIEATEQVDIVRTVLRIVATKLQQGEKPSSIAVISPEHGMIAGVDQLNLGLQQLLNPPAPNKLEYAGFRVGDRVVQMVNNWDLGVINGDKGTITRMYKDEVPVKNKYGNTIYRNGRPVKISVVKMDVLMDTGNTTITYTASKSPEYNSVSGLHLGYAMTVHKMQGDAADICICVVSKSMTYFLDRTLLYTAQTRAVKQMIFVGSAQTFWIALRKIKDRSRTSLLKQRIWGRVEDVSPIKNMPVPAGKKLYSASDIKQINAWRRRNAGKKRK